MRKFDCSSVVNGIALSLDGSTIAAACQDNKIRLWRISDQQLLAMLEGHSASVNGIAFSPDGKTLASGSDDQTVRLWAVW